MRNRGNNSAGGTFALAMIAVIVGVPTATVSILMLLSPKVENVESIKALVIAGAGSTLATAGLLVFTAVLVSYHKNKK